MTSALETIVINDNNPNLLGVAVIILAVVYIIFAVIEIRANNKKRDRLKKIRNFKWLDVSIVKTMIPYDTFSPSAKKVPHCGGFLPLL